MTQAEFLGWAGIIVGLIGYVPYFISIYQNKTKPHAFSWFVWGLLTSIAYLALVSEGAGPGAWVNGFSALACFIIVIIALFKGEKDIPKSDWLAFIGALAALPMWHITKDALWAIILITAIDLVAFYPTFRKSWFKPFEEEPLTYILSGLKFFLATMAIEKLNLTTALYPLSLVLMNWVFVTMILWRRKAIPVHG